MRDIRFGGPFNEEKASEKVIPVRENLAGIGKKRSALPLARTRGRPDLTRARSRSKARALESELVRQMAGGK